MSTEAQLACVMNELNDNFTTNGRNELEWTAIVLNWKNVSHDNFLIHYHLT